MRCCDGRAVILAPVAIGAGCQAVTGWKQLLSGKRGRVTEDGFQ